jgi:putative ABC transport system permease protein
VIGAETSGQPHIYLPYGRQYMADMHLHLRTAAMDADGMARFFGTVRREIAAVDGGLPVLGVTSLRSHVESSADYWLLQTGTRMFSLFGGIALLLAVIGLYGVRAYSVARRTREIGIRMALGASAAETQKMVLVEGVKLMAVGAAIGLALSAVLGMVLARLLLQVNGLDPLVFSTAALLLAAVSMLACYLPARRASRIDPMVALRWE